MTVQNAQVGRVCSAHSNFLEQHSTIMVLLKPPTSNNL